jgi:hypothetical protein
VWMCGVWECGRWECGRWEWCRWTAQTTGAYCGQYGISTVLPTSSQTHMM